jgi:hypothetical protein
MSARFELPTAVCMKTQWLWDMMLCSVLSFGSFKRLVIVTSSGSSSSRKMTYDSSGCWQLHIQGHSTIGNCTPKDTAPFAATHPGTCHCLQLHTQGHSIIGIYTLKDTALLASTHPRTQHNIPDLDFQNNG